MSPLGQELDFEESGVSRELGGQGAAGDRFLEDQLGQPPCQGQNEASEQMAVRRAGEERFGESRK